MCSEVLCSRCYADVDVTGVGVGVVQGSVGVWV